MRVAWENCRTVHGRQRVTSPAWCILQRDTDIRNCARITLSLSRFSCLRHHAFCFEQCTLGTYVEQWLLRTSLQEHTTDRVSELVAMIRKRPFDSDTSSETDVLSENKRVKLATTTVPGEHAL